MPKLSEKVLALLGYFSGLAAAVVFFLTENEWSKKHAFQGMVFAASIWTLNFIGRFIDTYLPTIHIPIAGFPSGGIFSVLGDLVYIFSVLIGLIAFLNKDILLIEDK